MGRGVGEGVGRGVGEGVGEGGWEREWRGGWERVWGGVWEASLHMHSFADFNRKSPYVNSVECDSHNVNVFTVCFLSLVLHNC